MFMVTYNIYGHILFTGVNFRVRKGHGTTIFILLRLYLLYLMLILTTLVFTISELFWRRLSTVPRVCVYFLSEFRFPTKFIFLYFTTCICVIKLWWSIFSFHLCLIVFYNCNFCTLISVRLYFEFCVHLLCFCVYISMIIILVRFYFSTFLF